MFGNLENMKKQQEMLQEKLKSIEIQAQADNGKVHVTVNAAREVLNISISPDLIKEGDHEIVEDLVLVAINRAMEKAAEKEQEVTQSSLKDMLPPGMENLFG